MATASWKKAKNVTAAVMRSAIKYFIAIYRIEWC